MNPLDNRLILSNGTVINDPKILTSGAGWKLRPDDARHPDEIRRETNKSFGRGSEGRRLADEWKRQYLQQQFDRAGWSPVVSHDYYSSDGYLGGQGVNVSITDPLHGRNQFSYRVIEPRYGSGGWITKTQWTGSALQLWYRERTVTDENPLARMVLAVTEETYGSRSPVMYEQTEEFTKDPFAFVQKVTGAVIPWTLSDIPPLNWHGRKAFDEYADDDEAVQYSIDQDHQFFRKGTQAQSVFVESEEEIQMLEKAFRHLGMDIRIGTGRNYSLPPDDPNYRKSIVQSLTIVMPADKHEQQNQAGHTIELGLRGIKVTCGYVNDDLKWEAWKGRQAADWLNEFEKENLAPSYEDYEYKPE